MPAPPTATGDELDLADLPPLDGDPGEEPVEPGEAGESNVTEDVGPETAEGLDDSTGEDDDPHPDDLNVDPGEGGWLDEPSDAPGLAIGAIEIDDVEDASAVLSADEGTPADDREAVDVDPVQAGDQGGLDSGEEGPDGPDEELRDQDLPSLGAAEDDEAPGDPGASDLLLETPDLDEPLGLGWAPKPWTRVGAPVPIASAIAVACAARGALVAGYREASAPLELFRIDLEGSCQSVAALDPTGLGPVRRLALEGGAVASFGDRSAYADAKEVVLVGGDGAARRFSLGGTVVALSFVDAGQGLVAAVYSESDDTTGLVRVDASGPPRVMGLLGPTPADMESDGRALALAVDDPRGVVWVAGGFGVAAFSIR
jgi:hypothetical protein